MSNQNSWGDQQLLFKVLALVLGLAIGVYLNVSRLWYWFLEKVWK